MQDAFSLESRVALVTGGSRGLGRMIAKGFIDAGARVYISARKAPACDAAARELGPNCISMPHDLSTMDGIRALATDMAAREPAIDILVNNAGAAWGAGFDDFPEVGWDKILTVNLKSPFFLTQQLHASLKAGVRDGHLAKVINIASIDGMSISPQETYSYQASKAALIHLTRRMAARMAPEGIVVTGIAPGAFASDMNPLARDDPGFMAKRIPLGRVGADLDLAGAAVFLASRAGDYVVGATIPVDGGVTLASFGRGPVEEHEA